MQSVLFLTTIHFLSPPLPQRPSWLLAPEFSLLVSVRARTWQVNEGRSRHSFLENCGLDKLPEAEVYPTGFSRSLVQRGLCRHMNRHWKRGGDLQAHPECEMWFLVVPPLTSAQSVPPGRQDGLRRSRPRNPF